LKVLFVNPYQVHLVNKQGKIYNRVWPPLSLANCAALLEREGHYVRILDANAERLSADEVARRAVGFDKIFISSSSLDRWQCPNLDLFPFLRTVEAVRKVTDEVFILGAHGTVRPKEMLEWTRAKAAIIGEPESTVVDLCGGKELRDVRGIAFIEDGKVSITQDQEPFDLDALPMPAFHLLPMDKYYYEVLGSNFTLFEGSRGCASRCTFCLLKMYGRGVRSKSVEKRIDEIEYAISRFGVKTAYFMDLEFTVFRRQVLELCDYLIKKRYDFHWTCQTRFDLIDEALLQKMRKAGCRLIHFGVEAGSDELLKAINKRITLKQIEEGMKMVHSAKIESACFFMLGFPNSDLSEIKKTVDFAKRLNPTYALFHVTIPYPGTALYEMMRDSGQRLSDNGVFPEACVEGEMLEKVRRSAQRAYIEFYLRPKYVFSRLSKGELGLLLQQLKLFLEYVQ